MSLVDMPLVDMKHSSSFKKLLQRAEKDHIDTEVLRDILWRITAHCHLIALPVAAENLLEMLRIAPDTWSSARKDSGIDEWISVLKWIVTERETLTSEIGTHFGVEANASKRNPMRGHGLSIYSAYGALCEPVGQSQDGRRYLLAMGQFIIAYLIAIRDPMHSTRQQYEEDGSKTNWNFLPNSVEDAARAVRRSADQRHPDFLKESTADGTPDEFMESLADEILQLGRQVEEKYLAGITESRDESASRSDLKSLTYFLEKCHGLRNWRDAGRGGSFGSGGYQWIGGLLEMHQTVTREEIQQGDAHDPCFEWGKVDLVRIRTTKPREKRALLESDSHPDEAVSDNDVMLDVQDCRESIQDAGALAAAAAAKARHFTLANQLFEWTYSGLTVDEIANLLKSTGDAIREVASNPGKRTSKRVLIEALTLIHVMLWTGSDASRASGIRICMPGKASREALTVVLPDGKFIDSISWRVAALQPDYKTDLEPNPDQTRNNDAYLDLPDHVGMAPIVSMVIEGRKLIEHNDRLFETPRETLVKLAEDWLNSHFPDRRVTMNKIADTLWLRIHAQTGDPAIASLVNGRMHSLARVRLFYTTLSAHFLREQYTKVVQRLTENAYLVIGKPQKKVTPWLPQDVSTGSIGARLCPTVDAVRDMFAKLATDIKNKEGFTDRKQFVEYHNLYTLFCILVFGYGTGCRAVTTPYLELSDIPFSRKFASLSDKDDERHSKTRVVMASEYLRVQMEHYAAHIAAFKLQLGKKLRVMGAEPCFFLDERLRPEEVRPGTIQPLLSKYLKVGANTHRRFLRSELIERGCDGEIIDAFLGHWQNGEEPHGIYSSFVYKEYIEALGLYLDKIFEDIGLTQSIRSALAS